MSSTTKEGLILSRDILMVCICGESLPPFWFQDSAFRRYAFDALYTDDIREVVQFLREVQPGLRGVAECDPRDTFEHHLDITKPESRHRWRGLGGALFRDKDFEFVVPSDIVDRLQLVAAACGWTRTLNWLIIESERLYAPATLFYTPDVLSLNITKCPSIVGADMRYGTRESEINREYTEAQLQDMWAREKYHLWAIIQRTIQRANMSNIIESERNNMDDSAYERLSDAIDREYSISQCI